MKLFIFKILSLSFLLFPLIVSAQEEPDSLKNIMVKWRLDSDFELKNEIIDTTQEMFHHFKAQEIHSISTAHLGNLGSASISQIFSKRPDIFEENFYFMLPYKIHLFSNDNVYFYNTRKPYTEFIHTTATKSRDEQTLYFVHTQNITPLLNFGLQYNMIASKGEYLNQENRLNSFAGTVNFSNKKKSYNIHAAFIINKFKLQNNGGLIDTVQTDISSLEANLSDAGTVLYNREIFAVQKFNFGKKEKYKIKDTTLVRVKPKFGLSHRFSLTRNYRLYQDKESFSNGYYTNFYFGSSETYDSTALEMITNEIAYSSEDEFEKKNKFGFKFSYTNLIKNYYNFKEYILSIEENYFIDNKLDMNLFYKSDSLQIHFNNDYYIGELKKNDFRTQFIFRKLFKKIEIKFNAKYVEQSPLYYIRSFYSNHYQWENDFEKETIIHSSFNVNMIPFKLSIGGEFYNLKNHIYFGSVALPHQYDQDLSILSANISKNFHFKHIHFHNKIIWQKSSNIDIIPLPELTFYHSTYLSLEYKNALSTHIGFDLYYTTEHKAYSFNPAVGQFFYENSGTTGNYPFGSVFINAKIKRNVYLFIKFEHVNSNIFREMYYFVNHYPINSRTFRFGVKWTFSN